MERFFKYFSKKTYYQAVESEVTRIFNILKIQADGKNNNNLIASIDEQLFFMDIYTQELLSYNLIAKDIFKKLDNDELEKYENELGGNFISTDNIKNLINEDNGNYNHNIKNLIPFYYHFAPVIYQYFDSLGMKMISFYFIGNDINCNQENINNLYFKYPLEDSNLGINIHPLNNKMYDYVIDPFIDCNNGYYLDEDLLETIKENNWYYNLIKDYKDLVINFRLLKLIKIDQENRRKDYLMAYNKFNFEINNNKIDFLLMIRFSQYNFIYPFVLKNELNDTLNYD